MDPTFEPSLLDLQMGDPTAWTVDLGKDPGLPIHGIMDGRALMMWAPTPLSEISREEVTEWFSLSTDPATPPLLDHIYDPTNGTPSEGIIVDWRSLD
jgi:hypothetical protein